MITNTGTFTIPNITQNALFDSQGTDNYAGLRSFIGQGDVKISAVANFIDTNFFTGGVPIGSFIVSLFESTNNTPFNKVNPSKLFTDGTSGGLGNITPDLGTFNGTGNDFQFQADASASFDIIPEQAVHWFSVYSEYVV